MLHAPSFAPFSALFLSPSPSFQKTATFPTPSPASSAPCPAPSDAHSAASSPAPSVPASLTISILQALRAATTRIITQLLEDWDRTACL